jgi:CelD/BcsL family acetyltransferase involved in cellulose biosynthesis
MTKPGSTVMCQHGDPASERSSVAQNAQTQRRDPSVNLITDFEAASHLRDAWDGLVEEVHGDIYFTYDWCRIWWRHYGQGRQLRVFLFHAGPELVGIVPLVIERLWVGPLPIRLARLLGMDSTLAVLHPPVRAEHAVAILRTVIERSFREFACDAVSFARLSGEFTTPEDLRRACGECGLGACIVTDRAISTHTVFHLPASFDEYLGGLSKSERGNYRRDERRLAECGPISARQVRAPDEIDAAFDRFAALHAEQWRQVGKLGHFRDWPRSLEFTRDLLRAFSLCGRGEIAEIAVGGVTVAMELNLRLGDTSYWRLPARSTDPEWEKRGIGRVALVRQIESLIAEGVRRIEAGSGHYLYKLRLGGVEYPLQSLLLARNHCWPRLKARVLGAYADVLNLAYYRIWFCRLAPRLPLPRRPLWKSWIRTRL